VKGVHGVLALDALFSLIDVGSGLPAYVVFLFFSCKMVLRCKLSYSATSNHERRKHVLSSDSHIVCLVENHAQVYMNPCWQAVTLQE